MCTINVGDGFASATRSSTFFPANMRVSTYNVQSTTSTVTYNLPTTAFTISTHNLQSTFYESDTILSLLIFMSFYSTISTMFL
jgi:hypothetical protein